MRTRLRRRNRLKRLFPGLFLAAALPVTAWLLFKAVPGLSGFTLQIWPGWLDLNQQMPVSETGALTIWRHPSILAGIGRLEHPRAVLETAVLPVKLYPCMMMVMPAGFEPSITSLRGLRPHQLDEGTRWRYGSDSNRRITVLQAALLNLLSTVSWLG